MLQPLLTRRSGDVVYRHRSMVSRQGARSSHVQLSPRPGPLLCVRGRVFPPRRYYLHFVGRYGTSRVHDHRITTGFSNVAYIRLHYAVVVKTTMVQSLRYHGRQGRPLPSP